jgi:AraC-like DNA-binding protein
MSFAAIFATILLLGWIQGLILTVLLFASKKNRYPNKFLATIMLLFSLASFNLFLYYTPLIKLPPVFSFVLNFIPLIIIMPIGPLLYFYVRSNFEPEFRLQKKHWWQFSPVILDIVPQLIAAVFVIGVLTNNIRNNPAPWGQAIDTYNVYADIPRWLSVSIYVGLSLKYLRLTGADSARQKWFRQFLSIFMVFQAIWFIYLVPYVIPSLTNYMLDTFDWYPVYIPLVILIYTLGIKGYLQPPQDAVPVKKAVPPSQTVVQEVVPALKQAMEHDRIYLNPELDLALLSDHTGIPPKTISAVLNQHLQQSFSEFINGYRVADFQQKALSEEFRDLTIMGIAFESGFNSQATFQRAFKQITGVSPREYIRQNTDN